MRWLWAFLLTSPAAADPLGLVDYPALMDARAETSFCTGGALCTVILPSGGVVQQDAGGAWLAGGDALSAGSFAQGFALIYALFDACGEHLRGVDTEVMERGISETLAAYRLGLEIEGTGQTAPPMADIEAAWEELRADMQLYIAGDPDLSRCIVPGPLATLLVEMAQEEYWAPELTRLVETPTLPTANFTIQ